MKFKDFAQRVIGPQFVLLSSGSSTTLRTPLRSSEDFLVELLGLRRGDLGAGQLGVDVVGDGLHRGRQPTAAAAQVAGRQLWQGGVELRVVQQKTSRIKDARDATSKSVPVRSWPRNWTRFWSGRNLSRPSSWVFLRRCSKTERSRTTMFTVCFKQCGSEQKTTAPVRSTGGSIANKQLPHDSRSR